VARQIDSQGHIDAQDARAAAKAGVDAIVISNHGGRQLDGAPAAIQMLPYVRDAVDDRTEILFDSGVASGQNVLKALALGARACLIGKAFLYGLGAMGQTGVTKEIDIHLRNELDVSMALTGQRDVRLITSDILLTRYGQPIA